MRADRWLFIFSDDDEKEKEKKGDLFSSSSSSSYSSFPFSRIGFHMPPYPHSLRFPAKNGDKGKKKVLGEKLFLREKRGILRGSFDPL